MSGYVRAIALQAEATQVSDGNDTAVTFTGYSSTKIDVSSFVRLSLYADVGAAGADITVKGYRTANAPAEDIYAKTTNASDAVILDAENIEGYAYVEVYEDGTATQSQTFYLVCK